MKLDNFNKVRDAISYLNDIDVILRIRRENKIRFFLKSGDPNYCVNVFTGEDLAKDITDALLKERIAVLEVLESLGVDTNKGL